MMNTIWLPFLLTTIVLLVTPDAASSFSSLLQIRRPPFSQGWLQHSPSPANNRATNSVLLHSTKERRKRKPSKVTDEDGPTPDLPPAEIEEVESIPELEDIRSKSEMPPGPIPHQPWRRGDTNGCEDPISAEWRVEAERIMKLSAKLVGGKVIDVTWFLTSVMVTLDEDLSGAQDPLKSSGPVIEFKPARGPLYYDPKDPKPDDIWINDEEDEIVYQRESEEAREERVEKKRNMYANKDEDDPEDEPHIPEGEDDTDEVGMYMNDETREDAAFPDTLDTKAQYDEEAKFWEEEYYSVDKAALSTIAGAMIDALTDAEEELKVLSRHELILSSPGPRDVLETQKQFDAHRNEEVIVETQDPWQSNRVLKGKLLDRNSMDVMINKKGRMVTIPLNFVSCVRLAFPPPMDEDEEQGELDAEEYAEEDFDEY